MSALFGAGPGVALRRSVDSLVPGRTRTVTGKSADDDLREGKQTLLIALAEEATDGAGRQLLADHLGSPAAGPEELQALRRLIEDTGARDRVEARITERTALARQAIAEASITPGARAALDALAVAATSRTA